MQNHKKFVLTMRSRTTGGTDTTEMTIPVYPDQNPVDVADTVASSYGAEVVSIVEVKPKSHRDALRECLGFVEAWHLHLHDGNQTKAAATVLQVLEDARASYEVVSNPIRTSEVEQLIAKHGDDIWGIHPIYPIEDWQFEVCNNDSRLGYWEWVLVKVSELENETETAAGN